MHEKLLSYVDRIAKILGKNYKFGIYDEDDIYQEIFLLVNHAQTLYNSEKGDEFLFYFNFIKKRLATLRRDNYYNPKLTHIDSMNKINGAEEIHEGSKLVDNRDIDLIDTEDLVSSVVDSKIPASFRLNYLRLLEGAEMNWHDKDRLLTVIKNIIWANDEKHKC